MAQFTAKQLRAFGAKCEPRESGCIEWTGGTNHDGYGEVWAGRTKWRAHRLAWTLAHGAIPPGLSVLHSCDNPRCANAKHMFLGTQADNMADCAAKGRSAKPKAAFIEAAKRDKRGALNPKAKLTPEQVLYVRASAHPGRQLAAELGVTPTNIRLIRSGKTWSNVRG